jgi:DNA (cytosine-5)-methyltransferase 1
MPDKDNLGAVLTPFRAGSIGGYTEGDAAGTLRAAGGDLGGGSENLAVCGALCHRITNTSVQEAAAGHLIAVPIQDGRDIANKVQYDPVIREDDAMPSMVARGPHAVATMGTPGSSVNASGPRVMQAYPINGMCLNKELRDKQMTGIGEDGDAMYTVRANGTQHAIGFNWQSGGDCRGLDPKATVQLQRCQTPAVYHALRDEGFDASEDGTGRETQQVAAVHAATMTVRRLTPRECERLQAFPDDYTMIPWRKKPADQCPDGPRYKALGNSMAVNCMEWIGERIAAYEARSKA